ncbi:MAG: hypothetical protein K0R77_1660 [Chryseobacterium sp.]|jgi:hypothetical protein|uniref:hypothetical protein n=1 Tax=Chryseobacterium sp. TaxID=1871047 RepID=UPI0026081A83|nr:hypothetical protein [Chryseobacterium sp.]MDF2552385.1 hypothetical protein [Chryseobacterium sp.]
MQIQYNSTILSNADNLQDLALNLIYDRTSLFLNKPEFKSNILIPDTLRSYNELVSCFKDRDSLKKFENYLYYRISSEFDSNKVMVLNKLSNANDEMFLIQLLNSLTDFDHTYGQSEITTEIFNTKNPYNISIADLTSSFNYIEDNCGLNDYNNKRFIDFLRIYTAFRISNFSDILKTNLLKGGLVNDHYSIFPRQLKDDFRRDQIVFNYKSVVESFPDHEVWLNYFIIYTGSLKADYRLDDENIYERKRLTRLYDNACFSPLFPIVSLFCINENMPTSSDLVNECIDWCVNNQNLKSLFLNPLFLNEFNKRLDNFSKHKMKDSLGSYSDIVFDYVFVGIPFVVKDLKLKYPFLNFLDSETIINNPIYNIWFNNREEYCKIIDDVYRNNFLQTYSSETIATAQKALEKYEKYFDKTNKNTSQGTKQAMNFLVKLFVKDKEIHQEFKKFRSQMDRQYNNGLNNIHNLLNKISNG